MFITINNVLQELNLKIAELTDILVNSDDFEYKNTLAAEINGLEFAVGLVEKKISSLKLNSK